MTRATSKPNHLCYIGLGSNLDNPKQQVIEALAALVLIPNTELIKQSALYRSDPVGPPGQPDYINAVAAIRTLLEPEQLLDALQAIEQDHQRIRKIHWGPRTLDLDIILFGDQSIATERLTVPHPFAHERNFVLWPLAEIAPSGLQFPNGNTLTHLLVSNPLGTLEKISV
jgi:2-amino-4-hydroxy-6-hydroxymethyldihydropteridine diphosphokinase